MNRWLRFNWLLILPLLILGGCGKGRTPCVPVSGRVLLDGKPVPQGFIRVIPANGRPATGTLDADGRFRLTTFDDGDGCIRGTHAVEVIARQRISPTQSRWLAPRRYFDAATSGITVTVDKATDALQIDLVSDHEKPPVENVDTGGDMLPGVTVP